MSALNENLSFSFVHRESRSAKLLLEDVIPKGISGLGRR